MAKRVTTISIDHELLEKAKQRKIQISSFLNEQLKHHLAMESKQLTEIEAEQKRQELKQVQVKLDELRLQEKELLLTLKAIDEQKQEKKIQDLEQRKKEIAARNSCFHCGSVFSDESKRIRFNKIEVCKECFMTEARPHQKEWLEATGHEPKKLPSFNLEGKQE